MRAREPQVMAPNWRVPVEILLGFLTGIAVGLAVAALWSGR